MKYSIIISYRDREEHLERFSKNAVNFFEKMGVSFKIIIVEQSPDKRFNLGKITNIGFDILKKNGGFSEEDSFIFHPVDCIPFLKDEEDPVDYEAPRGSFVMLTRPGETRFYKGFSIDPVIYEKINGLTNLCWGYGGEDDELFHRLRTNNIPVVKRQMIMDEMLHDDMFDGSNHPANLSVPRSAGGLSDLNYSIVDKKQKYGLDTFICEV